MEKPATNFYLTAKKIWDIAVKSDSEYTAELELQLEMHKRLLNIFQVGNYYYFVFNVFQGAFDFVSEEIRNVLGYEPEEYTTEKMLDKIHPDDKIYFLNFEQGSIEFFKNLPFDKIKKYKAQYDYRIKAKNNKYARILQQIVPIEYDETNFYHTLGIHTDISHIKQDGNPCFSLIGIDNEPSYYNIQDMVVFDGQTHNLSIKKQIDKNNDIDSLVLTDGTVTLTYKYVYATMTPSITISIPGHTIDSTLGTLYDWRHPQIYIQFQEPIKLYEGEASSTMNTSFIKLTYNMSLDYPNKTFNLIEKCTGSSNLTDIGTVYTYNGAFTETSTELLLTIDSETLTLTKVGNDLKLSESGPDNYTNNIFFKKK
jgi:hypothetical protein